MLFNIILYLVSYVSTTENNLNSTQHEELQANSNKTPIKDDLSSYEEIDTLPEKTASEADGARQNNALCKNEDYESITDKNLPFEEPSSDQLIQDDNRSRSEYNETDGLPQLSANIKNNIRYRAWLKTFNNKKEIKSSSHKAFDRKKSSYMSKHENDNDEVNALPLSDRLAASHVKHTKDKIIFSDLCLMEKYRDAFHKQMSELGDALTHEEKIYHKQSDYTYEPPVGSIFYAKSWTQYLWNLGFMRQSSSSLFDKINIIINYMRDICNQSDDADIKEVLAEVHESTLDFIVRIKYMKNIIPQLAINEAMSAIQYKPSDCFRKTYPNLSVQESENDLPNIKEQTSYIYTSRGMNYFFERYLLFCKHKIMLLKIYKTKCYTGEAYCAKKEKIGASFQYIKLLVEQIVQMGNGSDKYWMKFMLERINNELQELYIKKEENQLATSTSAENDDKLVEANRERTDEEKNIAMFYEMCDFIQAKCLNAAAKNKGDFVIHEITDHILTRSEIKRFERHYQRHGNTPLFSEDCAKQ